MGLEKKKKEINLHWQLVNLSPVKAKRFYHGAHMTQCETLSKKSKMVFSAPGSALSHDLGSHNIHREEASLCCKCNYRQFAGVVIIVCEHRTQHRVRTEPNPNLYLNPRGYKHPLRIRIIGLKSYPEGVFMTFVFKFSCVCDIILVPLVSLLFLTKFTFIHVY